MLLSLISVLSLLISWGIYAFDFTLPGLWKLPAFFLLAWVGLFLLAFLFLLLCCGLVSLKKPQENISPFYRRLALVYNQAVLSLLRVRVQSSGFENLPKNGRFLLVCNHLHLLDPLVLLTAVKDVPLSFISKKENQRLFLVNKLMHKLLCQPIDRENDRAALKTILKCISLLNEDKTNIAVFPEGYTSKDGKLHPFRNGVFKIAQKAEVPVVVCTLENTQYIFRNALHGKRTVVPLRLLTVIPAAEAKSLKTVELGAKIHEQMAQSLA